MISSVEISLVEISLVKVSSVEVSSVLVIESTLVEGSGLLLSALRSRLLDLWFRLFAVDDVGERENESLVEVHLVSLGESVQLNAHLWSDREVGLRLLSEHLVDFTDNLTIGLGVAHLLVEHRHVLNGGFENELLESGVRILADF